MVQILLAAILAVVAAVFYFRGLGTAADVAGVISIVLAVAPIATKTLSWTRARSSDIPTRAQLAQAKETLHVQVELQCRREIETRLLDDPVAMPTHWHLGRAEMLDRKNLSRSAMGISGRSDQVKNLVASFRILDRPRLVILGPAGSGKTTLSLQILRELLHEKGDDRPMPVLFSIANWDPSVEPRLYSWLEQRLIEDYPAVKAIHHYAATHLFEDGYLFPILDGLDELSEDNLERALDSINSSILATDHLIVTCRTNRYYDAVMRADFLTAAAVIEPGPLTPIQVEEYLGACMPPGLSTSWAPVFRALREGEAVALASASSTALCLWLLRTVYLKNRLDPAALLGYRDVSQIQRHLFDQLIPSVLAQRPPVDDGVAILRPSRTWNSEDTKRWLRWLAQNFRDGPDVSWWSIAPHAAEKVLPAIVLVGSLFGLLFGASFFFLGGLWTGIATGFWATLIASSFVWAHMTERFRPHYVNFSFSSPSHLVEELLISLFVAVKMGLIFAMIFLLPAIVATGALGALEVTLVVGLGTGATAFACTLVEGPSVKEAPGTPLRTFFGDRNAMLIETFLSGMIGFFAAGLLGAQYLPLPAAILLALALGPVGAFLGMTGGYSRAWLAFQVARIGLAASGRLPWRTIRFFSDMNSLGLFRCVGSSYQFRHLDFQNYLLASAEATPTRVPEA